MIARKEQIVDIWARRGEWAKQEIERWITREQTDEAFWLELVYSMLTVQVTFRTAQGTFRALVENDLLDINQSPSEEKLTLHLRLAGYRFWRTRARWILENMRFVREKWDGSMLKLVGAFPDDAKLRNCVAENFKGIGMAKTSLFCRNIGRGRNLTIIDRHILSFIEEIITPEVVPLTQKNYVGYENKLRDIASGLGTDMATLDCALWSEVSGWVRRPYGGSPP
ncbi:putative N-glycosylase/DNA lyase [subsurface metagenome]